MGELSDIPLEELLAKAKEVGALDRWEIRGDVLVFKSSTMQIAVEEPNAKTFVRGLLRGYEMALAIEKAQHSSKTEQGP